MAKLREAFPSPEALPPLAVGEKWLRTTPKSDPVTDKIVEQALIAHAAYRRIAELEAALSRVQDTADGVLDQLSADLAQERAAREEFAEKWAKAILERNEARAALAEAQASHASYLNYTQPAIIRRAERAEAAHLKAEKALAEIASVVEPHWKGAGLPLESEWIVREIVGLGTKLDDAEERVTELMAAVQDGEAERDTIVRIIAATRNEIRAEGPACCMRTLRLMIRDIKEAVPAVADALALP
jgi:hypothetical protein